MVEWVGLVAFSFQFFSRLAAVVAEEVGHGAAWLYEFKTKFHCSSLRSLGLYASSGSGMINVGR